MKRNIIGAGIIIVAIWMGAVASQVFGDGPYLIASLLTCFVLGFAGLATICTT